MVNILQAVQTYQKSSLGLLQNELVLVSKANTKFNEFNKTFAPNNLGNTVTFDLPSRFYSNNTLVVDSFDGVEQRVQSLTVNQKGNVNYAINNEEYIFNLEPNDYMTEFGRDAMAELGNQIEIKVSNVITQSCFRFYGNGITPLNSFPQLATAHAFHKSFGAPAMGNLEAIIPLIDQPAIIGTGQNQFVPQRNDEQYNSWEIGSFNRVNYSTSTVLPVFTAGTLGNDGAVLTVVSTNDPTGAAITAITFSGAGTDANAVAQNDLGYFVDGVSGQPNLRYRTFIGHAISPCPVQLNLNAAASSGGNVTVTFNPPLSSVPGRNQNLNTNIVAGMQFKILPDHKRGLILGGNALYVALPTLPTQTPFPTANKIDDTSKIGLRMTYGTIFGKAEQGIIYDYIMGYTMVPEYTSALIFPI